MLLKRCRVWSEEKGEGVVKHNGDLLIDVKFVFVQEPWTDVMTIVFNDREARNMAVCYVRIPDEYFRTDRDADFTVRIARFPFSAGTIAVTISFVETLKETLNGRVVSQYQSTASFKVVDSLTVTNIPVQLDGELIPSG